MQIPDVNVLVYAHRRDSEEHQGNREWLERLAGGQEAFGLLDLVCSGFLRIVTNPRAFKTPTPLEIALRFLEDLRSQPNCSIVAPGARHWSIFVDLCRTVAARGNIIPDAYLAAIAIESGGEWVTNDGDFARFRGLRWRRPS
jgi:toxin-antitoxin system PIN domain toxin